MKNSALSIALIALISFSSAASAPRCETCDRDQHGRIQRSTSAKTEFKRGQPCPSTLKPRGACPGYVIDHVIALKRSGADLPGNMQWQTTAEARAKDRWE